MKFLINIFLLMALPVCARALPNVIIIMSDDKGFNEVGWTPGATSEFDTPELDTLAANGCILEQFHVQPACSPTRSELLTGRWAGRSAMQYAVLGAHSDDSIPRNEKLLPDYLKELGYVTAWIGKWHVGKMQNWQMPHARGFDYAYGTLSGLNGYTNRLVSAAGNLYDYNEQGRVVNDGTASTHFTYHCTNKAIEFIQAQAADASSPFFLYLAYTTPHTPLVAPSDVTYAGPGGKDSTFQKRWRMSKGEDNDIKRIYDELVAQGVLGNTVIIYTSDNGGELSASTAASNLPHKGGKADITEGGTHVPAFVYYNGTILPGSTVGQVLDIKDVLPTIIEGLCGAPVTYRNAIDGRNFWPLIDGTGDAVFDSRIVIGAYDADRGWYAYQGGLKFGDGISHTQDLLTADHGSYQFVMQRPTDDINRTAFPHTQEVYNLATDAAEATNVYASNTAAFATVEAYMQALAPVAPANLLTPYGTQPSGWVAPASGSFGNFKDFHDPAYYYAP